MNDPHPPYVTFPSMSVISSPAFPKALKTAPTVSIGLSGVETNSSGSSESGTIAHPATLTTSIPIITAPFWSRAINAPITTNPIKAQNSPDS